MDIDQNIGNISNIVNNIVGYILYWMPKFWYYIHVTDPHWLICNPWFIHYTDFLFLKTCREEPKQSTTTSLSCWLHIQLHQSFLFFPLILQPLSILRWLIKTFALQSTEFYLIILYLDALCTSSDQLMQQNDKIRLVAKYINSSFYM